MWSSCKAAACQHFWKLRYANKGGLVTMRVWDLIRSWQPQSTCSSEHHLLLLFALHVDTEDGAGFSQWGKQPSLKGQQTERISVVFLSHVLLHNSPVCDSTLSIMKENYFLWKCLLSFFSEQPNETLYSLEARRSHGNSAFPLWFPFFSIFISTLTLPLCVTLLSSLATSLPIVLLFPIILLSSFSPWYFLSDMLNFLLLGCFSG